MIKQLTSKLNETNLFSNSKNSFGPSANLYYKSRCLCVCQHSNVQTLTSPPILKLWDTQGYLWLPYDLTEVIKLIKERFEPKNIFFQKNSLCHSFCIIVIPSVLVSSLPNIVIRSELLSFQIFVILNSSSTLPYPKGEKISRQSQPYLRV